MANYVKSESKYDSTCTHDGCENKIVKGAEYIYDTEGKKAYCLKHDEIMSEVKPKQNSSGRYTPKFSLSKAEEIYAKAVFLTAEYTKSNTLEPKDRAMMVESFFKTLSGSYRE